MKATLTKAQFEAEFSSRFATALQPRRKPTTEAVPSGIAEVDKFLGGFPRGAITEIFGPASSGRTTLMLSSLAEATAREEVCAVIDTTNNFHPASASLAGTRLDRVLWLRCGATLEHAFKAADLLLQGGGFGLVILDLADVPAVAARRIISSWWYRFRRVVENKPTALVVLAQDSCVRSCATLTLELSCTAEVWSRTYQAFYPEVKHSFTTPSQTQAQPTHGNFLSGLRLRVERQKPLGPKEQHVTFNASAF
jgi:hypothetical protein